MHINKVLSFNALGVFIYISQNYTDITRVKSLNKRRIHSILLCYLVLTLPLMNHPIITSFIMVLGVQGPL